MRNAGLCDLRTGMPLRGLHPLTLPALALLAAAALAQTGCVSKARYMRPQRPG